jgi:hypothetical protein
MLITSHRGEQLEDRDGQVGLHADKGDWQKWTISDAGNSKFFITSHRGKQLEDRDGQVGLSDDADGWQEWTISDAGNSKFFITGHRGEQLEDRDGQVGMTVDTGGWQEWTITDEARRSAPVSLQTDKVGRSLQKPLTMTQPEGKAQQYRRAGESYTVLHSNAVMTKFEMRAMDILSWAGAYYSAVLVDTNAEGHTQYILDYMGSTSPTDTLWQIVYTREWNGEFASTLVYL